MSLVLFEKKGPIGKIIFNHPDKLNAMTHEMGEALNSLISQLNQDPDLRVIIVTGAGRTFSAGGDFKFILDHRESTYEANQKEMVEFYGKFLDLQKIEVPTIAMINGAAVGAGMLIACACDLRYAASGAKMGVNFAKIGLSSGMGGLYWLTRLAGPAVAADLLFTGRIFLSEEAKTLGLINDCFAKEELENKVLEIANDISKNAPLALKIMKRGIQKTLTLNLEETLEYESHGQAKCFHSQDLAEGIEAIKAKRSPEFHGK